MDRHNATLCRALDSGSVPFGTDGFYDCMFHKERKMRQWTRRGERMQTDASNGHEHSTDSKSMPISSSAQSLHIPGRVSAMARASYLFPRKPTRTRSQRMGWWVGDSNNPRSSTHRETKQPGKAARLGPPKYINEGFSSSLSLSFSV